MWRGARGGGLRSRTVMGLKLIPWVTSQVVWSASLGASVFLSIHIVLMGLIKNETVSVQSNIRA